MQEILSEFINFMSENGLPPASHSDIKATNQRENYQLADARNNKKHGYYKLEIVGDFGYGFFGDYRSDQCFSWHSKSSHKYSKSQIEEFKRKAQAERDANEKAKAEMHEQKAVYAQDYTVFLDECPDDHPYLVRKKIKGHGVLLSGNDIIIPMEDENKMWSFQKITPEGDKIYLKYAKKTGTWFTIEGDETICIAEGLATGASINEATGHTVKVTFDSGNLKFTADKIRALYPDNEIIICADNDHESVDVNGNPRNVGVLAATQAAEKIKAKLIYPDFTKNDMGLSDFNDYATKNGLDAVAKRIRLAQDLSGQNDGGISETDKLAPDDVQTSVIRPLAPAQDNWAQFLQVDEKGRLRKNSALNARLYIENSDLLRGIFRYNSFSKMITVCKCPPWENEETFKVRQLADHDYFNLLCYMEHEFGITVGKNTIIDSLESTAHNEENVFNPAIDYFESLKWDGISRLDDWLGRYVSDGSQGQEYLSMVGRKFMCGLAARAMYPAIKFDTMIILEGDQYGGKSRLARMLATIEGEEYFLDDFKDIENKDTLMKMQGKLIVEFPEITTMRKTEVDDLKAFVVRQTDVFRAPYGRQVIEAPRQCVFIGTVNPEGGYLRDVTGNRRYWPISCRDRLALKEIEPVIKQLHAEAAHLVKEGEQLWLSDYEYQLAVTEQNKRVVDDVWADRIEDIVNGAHSISSDDILDGLNISIDKRTPIMYKRIKDTMLKNGYRYGRFPMGMKRKRGYQKINKDSLL